MFIKTNINDKLLIINLIKKRKKSMKKIQRIIGVVIIIMGTGVINGCTGKPKHEIQAAFDEFLYIYPTENVMDLFDKFDDNFAISSHEKTELENRESVFEEIHLFFS